MVTDNPCTIPLCVRPVKCRGLCGAHYKTARLKGHEMPPGTRQQPIEQRLLAGAERDYLTGCLRWTGDHWAGRGYGRLHVSGKGRSVHRLAHEIWIGPIPEGHAVDHVHANGCRHKDCIEPAHLEAVTQAENNRRYRQTISPCPQGHSYDAYNTYVYHFTANDGTESFQRGCRICRNAAGRRRNERDKAGKAA